MPVSSRHGGAEPWDHVEDVMILSIVQVAARVDSSVGPGLTAGRFANR